MDITKKDNRESEETNMLREHREVLDYASQTYVDIFKNGKCVLWRGFDKIKKFDNFGDAYDYWYNNYVIKER